MPNWEVNFDFAGLYPNVMSSFNIDKELIRKLKISKILDKIKNDKGNDIKHC